MLENHPDTELCGFEGPEKKLRIDFKFNSQSVRCGNEQSEYLQGLRNATKEQWQDMLDEAKCTIISQTSNEYFDSYVLSESSLFVYPHTVIIKTCGTTTLLRCIPKLLKIAEETDMRVEFVFFSRKNFVFPGKQLFPHTSFDDEIAWLDQYFEGTGYTIGPLKGDHWYLYIADYSDNRRPSSDSDDEESVSPRRLPAASSDNTTFTLRKPETTIEVMMQDLDPKVMQQFIKDAAFPFVSPKHTTQQTGIDTLLPGSVIDEFAFDPCGYSMNGLLGDVYWTIHITPEDHCSFASFETNLPYDPKNPGAYSKLLNNLVSLFKPGRFTLTIFSEIDHAAADTESDCGTGTSGNEIFFDVLKANAIKGFAVKHKTLYEFDTHNLVMCNFAKHAPRPCTRLARN
eukprot:GEZU01038809.1.p1 GENE.GEZU01038809.1~~GEZU01038809.1.p1  ORF type:complete len:399 (+),score=111.24 GEZU01038809.1:342-1538(+)